MDYIDVNALVNDIEIIEELNDFEDNTETLEIIEFDEDNWEQIIEDGYQDLR